jgi:hypothetical protein
MYPTYPAGSKNTVVEFGEFRLLLLAKSQIVMPFHIACIIDFILFEPLPFGIIVTGEWVQ